MIDVTNGSPLADGGPRAHALQVGLPGARVVKAFNTSSFESQRCGALADAADLEAVARVLIGRSRSP